MLHVQLSEGDRPLTVLCLGAHSDDIEIGCGGTILRLMEDHPRATFSWVVFSGDEKRKKEAERSLRVLLGEDGPHSVTVNAFRDGFFPFYGKEIKEYFEGLKARVRPDLVFTHYRSDLHQDHRLISDLTWNTFRDHMILEYEIPKYDGDLGSPNTYVHLSEQISTRKVTHLMECFPSQHDNHWFSPETFQSLLWLRGIESNAPAKRAEAFYCRKVTL